MAGGVARPYLYSAVDLRCVTGMLEVSVITKMRSRQREFEPDPVPAVHSVRKDFAMERNHKMPRDMVADMNSPVYTGKADCLTCRKAQAHRGSSVVSIIGRIVSHHKMVLNYDSTDSVRWE